jgi:SAM-dependent methyltransferase
MEQAQPQPWKDYYERTKGRPPRPGLQKAVSFVADKDSALDLGSGALNDSQFLLAQGFKRVIAVDKVAVAEEIVKHLPADRFEYIISTFEDYEFGTERFDLINAQYALPFIAPDQFMRVYESIRASMKPGAILAGQFFGDRDGWKDDKKMNFHTKAESEGLLKDFRAIEFWEEEQDKNTAAGTMKHWHVFHFIVEKKS